MAPERSGRFRVAGCAAPARPRAEERPRRPERRLLSAAAPLRRLGCRVQRPGAFSVAFGKPALTRGRPGSGPTEGEGSRWELAPEEAAVRGASALKCSSLGWATAAAPEAPVSGGSRGRPDPPHPPPFFPGAPSPPAPPRPQLRARCGVRDLETRGLTLTQVTSPAPVSCL